MHKFTCKTGSGSTTSASGIRWRKPAAVFLDEIFQGRERCRTFWWFDLAGAGGASVNSLTRT
jgi:hypothetical protein